MKTLIILAFTLGLSLLTEPQYKNHIRITDDNVKVVFDQNLTFNDLVAIKLELEQNNIKIAYNDMQFNSFGKLQSIDYEITSNSRKVEASDLSKDNDKNIPIERF